MSYLIEIKHIEPITVAAMRYKGKVNEAGKYMRSLFQAVKGNVNGAPFFCYYDMDQETLIGDLELCLPSEETPHKKGVQKKELPQITAVCATHYGEYDTLNKTYQIMHHYIEKNSLKIQPPWREIYIKGPGAIFKGNPAKYITEIAIPITQD